MLSVSFTPLLVAPAGTCGALDCVGLCTAVHCHVVVPTNVCCRCWNQGCLVACIARPFLFAIPHARACSGLQTLLVVRAAREVTHLFNAGCVDTETLTTSCSQSNHQQRGSEKALKAATTVAR